MTTAHADWRFIVSAQPEQANRWYYDVQNAQGALLARVEIELASGQQKLGFQRRSIAHLVRRYLPPDTNFSALTQAELRLVDSSDPQAAEQALQHALQFAEEQGADIVFSAPSQPQQNDIFSHAAAICQLPVASFGPTDLLSISPAPHRHIHHVQAAFPNHSLHQKVKDQQQRKAIHAGLERWPNNSHITLATRYAKGLDAVIFDFDGVFSCTISARTQALPHVMHRLEHPLPTDNHSPLIPHPQEKDVTAANGENPIALLVPRYGEEHADTIRHIWTEVYRDHFLPHTQLLEGGLNTLALLKEQQIPFAIVSNSPPEYIRARLEEYFGDWVDENVPVYDMQDPDIKKPNPTLIHRAIEDLEAMHGRPFNKQRILFVGDTIETDIQGALNAGVQPVLIHNTSMLHQLQNLEGVGSVSLVEDHADLQAMINSLNNRSTLKHSPTK